MNSIEFTPMPSDAIYRHSGYNPADDLPAVHLTRCPGGWISFHSPDARRLAERLLAQGVSFSARVEALKKAGFSVVEIINRGTVPPRRNDRRRLFLR